MTAPRSLYLEVTDEIARLGRGGWSVVIKPLLPFGEYRAIDPHRRTIEISAREAPTPAELLEALRGVGRALGEMRWVGIPAA